jgi:hypothetical protein
MEVKMLCAKCKALTELPASFFKPLSEKQLIADIKFTHQPSLQALQSSSQSCTGCLLMLNSFSRPVTEEELKDNENPIVLQSSRSYYGLNEIFLYNDFWAEKPMKFMDWHADNIEKSETEQPHMKPGLLVTCEAVEESIKGDLEFFIPRGSLFYWFHIYSTNMRKGVPGLDGNIDGRATFTRSDSDGCFELADSWVQHCVEDHADCAAYSVNEPPKLPTRVLDLGPSSCSQEPYLLETNNETGLYATLSHCWGKSPGPLTTETHNLAERKRQIAMSTLPQSFQDAIAIARRLHLRYIWIDSLCIIQNSAEDWSKESKTMAEIYGNCHICISAVRAPDCHFGIFHTRDAIDSFEIDYIDPSTGSPIRLGLRKPMLARDFPTYTNLKDEFISGPLDERGWALQERLMSPRVLKYASGQLVWECQTATHCESRDGPLPVLHHSIPKTSLSPTNNLNLKSWRRWIRSEANASSQPASIEVYEMWYKIITDYSHKKLTFSSDKLPAISALASEFAKETGSEYLAGLWREDLCTGLLWIPVESPLPNGPGRSDVYRAPSWSWSSVNTVCTYRVAKTGTLENLATVASVSRIPRTISGRDVEYISLAMQALFQEVYLSVDVDDDGGRKRAYKYAVSEDTVTGTFDFPLDPPATTEDKFGVLILRKAVCLGWVDSSVLVDGLLLMEGVNEGGQSGWKRVGLTTIQESNFVEEQWEMRSLDLI